ncbi:MAG: hypothetical protein DRH90_01050, partial [Deltaproteobacteria bacterium]
KRSLHGVKLVYSSNPISSLQPWGKKILITIHINTSVINFYNLSIFSVFKKIINSVNNHKIE